MKKVLTLISLFAISTLTFAQSKRLVLVEQFTQASCGPCAPANRQAEPILQANRDKVVAIKHQVSFPGDDPMNKHNPNDIRARRNYYGVNSVPGAVIDGNGPDSPYNVITQTRIEEAAAIPSPFEINLTHNINRRFDAVEATMEITATQASSGTYKAYIVVIEKEIAFGTPPGTNGETEFYNVIKKILPTSSGTNLPSNWEVGDKQTIDVSWVFKNVYNIDEIAVVAYIQDNRGKGISQAAISEPNLQPAGPNDALITKTSGAGGFDLTGICGNHTSPVVEIMNAGTSTLTNLDIFYKINGGSEFKYEWNGFLSYLGKTTVTLPEVSFETRLDNYINVRTANPNGKTDDQSENDDLVARFYASPQTGINSYIETRPGPLPVGVTWTLIDSEGTAIAEGGPYSVPLQRQRTDVTLEPNACYKLIANNNSASLNGFVKLFNEQDEELMELKLEERAEYRGDFGTYNLSSLDKVLNINSLSIYPNPASTSSIVEFNMIEAAQMNFVLTNSIGQVIWSETENLSAGNQVKEIQVNNIPNGIYFLQLQTTEGTATKQIVIQR